MGLLSRRVISVVAGLVLGFTTIVVTPGPAGAATGTVTCSDQFLNGDNRLGPATLPTAGELAPIVHGYDPLAGMSAAQFLSTYWDPAANGGSGGWRFPPDNGYLIVNGAPVEYVLTLGRGQMLDRFGSVFGAFLAPEGTPYAERALPPMSLDNFDPNYTCNYHEYRVVHSFRVESGPIAPGFGQFGHGRQYQLVGSLVPGAPARLSVMWLLQNGYLAALD